LRLTDDGSRGLCKPLLLMP